MKRILIIALILLAHKNNLSYGQFDDYLDYGDLLEETTTKASFDDLYDFFTDSPPVTSPPSTARPRITPPAPKKTTTIRPTAKKGRTTVSRLPDPGLWEDPEVNSSCLKFFLKQIKNAKIPDL